MADYQTHLRYFQEEDAEILALSVDPLEKAKETVEQLGLAFPVAYGLKVPQDAERIGAYSEERRGIFHATDFILDRDSRVVHASYSTGPLGRITAQGSLSILQFMPGRITPGDVESFQDYLTTIRPAG